MHRTIGYLITAVMKPDGTAVGFFIFLPKLHVLNVMININSRIATAKQLSQPASGSHVSCRPCRPCDSGLMLMQQSSGNRGKYVYGSRISSQGHRSVRLPNISSKRCLSSCQTGGRQPASA